MDTRTALVAGASGLVGGHLLDALLENPLYQQVYSLGRRPLPKQHPRLTQRTVDFGRLDEEPLAPAEDAFCCLGTTLQKAGSQEAFRAVDHHAVLNFAKAARRAGVRRFLVVTAMGANAHSRIFYNRVKGEVEEALAAQGFESLIIARPSLLLGERSEHRAGERVATVVATVLRPLLRPLASRPIEGRTVARALVALAQEAPRGVRKVPSGELQTLGG
ncbi:oxidoreductase [Stigmatella aurantiaca]|uniref:NAD-dependent epimerase/dehydratase n=1 Tax=Stigmatella aurantiaca (strain DW4/3-1) TaxID=378806 RepID=Q09AV0_STIAD|nr:oxidoreductase [Stigmatella aurantiaca]ADO72428.1 NAD-dependent epimerase/dehydratase [Stigmatella aurantiaca DW4/3-1]EAU68912.1 nucleoside-diphosphate-sugar epimerases [Stigmatella aurantiaca DW4/3-1]